MMALSDRFLSFEFWTNAAACVGAVGIACCGVGFVAHFPALTTVGLWLILPMLLGGLVILVFIIPVLIASNARVKRANQSFEKPDARTEEP
jgi:hypothetical protein